MESSRSLYLEIGMLCVRQESKLIEQTRVGRDLDSFDGRQPSQRFIERARIDQFLLRRERVRIRLAARVRWPGQVAPDVHEARLAILLQIAQSIFRQVARLR